MLVTQAVYSALGLQDRSAGLSLSSLAEALAAQRLLAAIQKRHFEWVCALGKVARAWDARQAEAFRRIYLERDNLWAALEFGQRQPGEVAAAAELAQDLLAYWACRGPLGDIRRILAALTDATPPTSLPRARRR
jgi:predicted ATPase